jgi:hypothetical protein
MAAWLVSATTYPDVFLAFVNVVQVLGLAWIGYKQYTNHRDDPPK